MQTPLNNSFEQQLRSKAEKFSIKPSAKVWEGVSSQMEEDLVAGLANTAAKTSNSFFSNWMLNIMIPAVVLIGSGTIFYFNKMKPKNIDANDKNIVAKAVLTDQNSKSVVQNNAASMTQTLNPTTKNVYTKPTDSNGSSNEIVSGENAVAQSFGYSKVYDRNDNSNSTALNSSNNGSNTRVGETVFTKSDLQKISKKEMEHENQSDIKDHSIKPISF